MSQEQGIVRGDAHLKLGSAGFIIGAILIVIGRLLFPPSLGVGNWLEMKEVVGEQAVRLQACALLVIFGYWAVMIGTAGVYRSITAGGAAWARVGFYFHLVGTAVWTIVGMSLDVSFPAAIVNWLAAPDAGKDAAYIAVAAIPAFGRGLFPLEVIVYWLAFVFLGIGMVYSAVYPRWLGWGGLILGIIGVPLGILMTFTGREAMLGLFIVLLALTTLWFLVVGIWVARKAW
ncbi:MAG: hypothetical protein MUO23_13330 [Anaerolineales bacterium]|nr:hypothetical protein [Anaerolineales bacterium]